MRIWVDGDACPNAVKEILYRAAERVKVPLVLVANALLRPPPSKYISTVRVTAGLNVADDEIARRCAKGDLVITADIPLPSFVERSELLRHFPDEVAIRLLHELGVSHVVVHLDRYRSPRRERIADLLASRTDFQWLETGPEGARLYRLREPR